MSIATKLKDRNSAREAWQRSGLTYADLSTAALRKLGDILQRKLEESEILMSSVRVFSGQGERVDATGEVLWMEIRCRSHYFDNREAISFNRDGFVGFCGWADETNCKPFIAAFGEWVEGMAK
jgi:hypothetical protein